MATTASVDYLLDEVTTTELPLDSAAMLDEMHHNQITFEIPTHHDLQHIDTLHKFNTLLQRIGNVAYDSMAVDAGHHQHLDLQREQLEQQRQHMIITNEQIAKSVVLNLADLKSASSSGLERFFAGDDMHTIINYLWIGVVTSLVILSVIFIVFSCYFYRKFREWKKCNKDIRSHLSNDMYPGGTIITCDSVMVNGQGGETAYYQMESPPCYTIATGLPTYDEALHHQHFSYGMKFVYPSIAAVHHHPAMTGAAAITTATAAAAAAAAASTAGGIGIISNWEKDDLMLQRKDNKQQQQLNMLQQKQQKQKPKTRSGKMAPPPSYDAAASVALLAVSPALSPTDAEAELVNGEKVVAISICPEDDAAADGDTDTDAAVAVAVAAGSGDDANASHSADSDGVVVVVVA